VPRVTRPHSSAPQTDLSVTEHCNGFAQVYPEHKYVIVEALRQMGYSTGMTGDGVNDAPALKIADVGIAVSGATDAARAAADIVLTEPGLSIIVEAIIISRKVTMMLVLLLLLLVLCCCYCSCCCLFMY